MERRISVGFNVNVTPEASVWCLWALGACLLGFGWSVSGVFPLWMTKPEYRFAWAVPLLGLILFWKRWARRPEAWPADPFGFAVGLLAVSIPHGMLRWLGGANPDWMLPWIVDVILCVTVALLVVWRAGGSSWVLHFFSPLILFLAVLPWPGSIEYFFMENVGQMVAGIAAELWNVQGIAALPTGLMVEKVGGMVSTLETLHSEASLPALATAGWFWGAWFELRLKVRLLLWSSILPLFLAVGLSGVMGWISSWIGLGLAVFVLGVEAWILSAKVESASDLPLHDNVEVIRPKCYPPEIRWQSFAGVLLFFLVVEGGVWGWYVGRGVDMRNEGWRAPAGLSPTKVGERLDLGSGPLEKLLEKAEEVRAKRWIDVDGAHWSVCYAEKKAGPRTSEWMNGLKPGLFWNTERGFSPQEMGFWKIAAAGGTIPGRVFLYPENLTGTWIFYAVWPKAPADASEEEGYGSDPWGDRWEEAFAHRRRGEVRVLRVQVEHLRRQRDFRRELERLLKPGESSAP
jgi:hypothetical protein